MLNTAIAISHAEARWLPKSSEERFNQIVGRELQAIAGEHLQRNVTVQGVSGHQLEFPFVICSFFRQVCVVDFLFSGVPQASAGVGHAFAFAVQALVTLGGALL